MRTRHEGNRVLVEVADDGPGVPPKIRARIFGPFITARRSCEGTGLGLDIARRIVAGRHRGDIRVESEPNDARLRVRLPAGAPEAASDSRRRGSETAPQAWFQ